MKIIKGMKQRYWFHPEVDYFPILADYFPVFIDYFSIAWDLTVESKSVHDDVLREAWDGVFSQTLKNKLMFRFKSLLDYRTSLFLKQKSACATLDKKNGFWNISDFLID